MSVVVHHEVTPGPAGAPTVVLANSLGSTLAMWDRQLAALAQACTVVRFDTRGHGRSPVPPGPYAIEDLVDDALALLHRLGLDRVHFVGLSLGGMVGMRLAARAPERVDRLAVLCTGARLEPSQAWRDRAALVRAEGTGAVTSAVIARWYTQRFRVANPALVARAEAMVAATPAEGYAACCEVIAEMDLRPDLAAICAPTLALAGSDDPATPPECLAAIADGVQHGRLVVVPAAHLANDEQPEAVIAALLDHLGARVLR